MNYDEKSNPIIKLLFVIETVAFSAIMAIYFLNTFGIVYNDPRILFTIFTFWPILFCFMIIFIVIYIMEKREKVLPVKKIYYRLSVLFQILGSAVAFILFAGSVG